MASRIIVLLSATLFLNLIGKGTCRCTLADVKVFQAPVVGDGIKGGQPEWWVSILNGCGCTQTNLRFSCPGFASAVVKMGPSKISVAGDACLVDSGGPVAGQSSINFKYAASKEVPFTPLSSQVTC